MPKRQLPLVTIVALSIAIMFSPTTATAQLGRLKKAASDAAKEKVGVKNDSPSSASNNYVITAERLSAVIAMMETSMARAQKEAAAEAAQADYEKKRKAYEGCIETQLKSLNGKPPATDGLQRAAAMTQKTGEIAQRLSAAQRSGKHREYIALTDTMEITSLRSTLVMYNLDTKCGAPVYMPPAIIDASAAQMSHSNSESSNESSETVVPASARGGMSTQQFGMVRERMALWVLLQTNNAPANNNKYGVFTSEEQTVLDAQAPKIKQWAAVFKTQPYTWATWGDIKGW